MKEREKGGNFDSISTYSIMNASSCDKKAWLEKRKRKKRGR